jgi:hypothetical protein
MTYVANQAGMVSVEDSHRILRAIFPNYPDPMPCKSHTEPRTDRTFSREDAVLKIVVARWVDKVGREITRAYARGANSK